MIARIMGGLRLRGVVVVLAVLAGSQLGHAIAYYARFGLDAGRLQSEGAHWYLPALAGGLSAALGIVVMTALIVVAMARSLGPVPAGYRRRATLRFFDVLPVLFTVQLVLFAGQETAEGLAAGGGHLISVGELLIWGALGQLPAAAAAAAVVCWLLTRLEAAWTIVLEGVVRSLPEPLVPVVRRVVRLDVGPALRLETAFPAAFRKRGPPAS
jgi:hypothetical protein